ncbi:MAG: hypothetical protein K2I00_04680 [Ruminococcus sp.]|nr:hypothetical protein [Ruminococcus sp.]
MKKFTSLLTVLAVSALSLSSIPAYAEDNSVLELVGENVYNQLLRHSAIDLNGDKTITSDELRTAEYLYLSLDNVDNLSWLPEMKNLRRITLTGGENPELSVLEQLPNLQNVQLDSVGTDNISFAENMNLDSLSLFNMDNITTEQRLKVARFQDYRIERGFTEQIGVLPLNLFYDYDSKIYIKDSDTATFFPSSWATDEKGEYVNSADSFIYGKSAGTTEYTIEIDGQEIHSGKIEISEPAVQDFPPVGQEEYCSETTYSDFYGDDVVLTGGKLYGILNGKPYLYEQNVEKFRHVYYNGDTSDFQSYDGIILSDGTFRINGQTIENPDGAKFIDAMNYYILDENGRIYAIEKNNGEFSAVPIGENCREFIENSLFYAVSDEGEIIYLKNKNTDDEIKYTVFNTGIMNCISMKNDYFVDENNVLWEVIRYGNKPSVKKKADDVVFVGYRWYSDGMVSGCVHIKSDGTAYRAGSDSKVELFDAKNDEMCCKQFGYFTIEEIGAGGMSDYSSSPNYIITDNNELTLSFNDTKTVIPDVACVIKGVTDNEKAEVLFIRTDNTIWKYNLPDGTYNQLIAEEPEKSAEFDVNGDGFFTIADGTALESYLLKDVQPANLNAGDINKDNKVDIFDFILMRKKLIEKNAL